ncbi:MAG: DJ-1/PfpI family protein, partial [Candidatus Thorarchaeota archaeon]
VVVLVISLLICISLVHAPEVTATQCCATTEDMDILMIIATGFGWNYWEIREQFEAWGVNVTTIANSLNYEVQSCPNREPRPVTADILLSDFNFSDLVNYDAVYIPAGGHWSGLISSNRVLSFISTAHEMGLVIGTTCIGNRVLNRANNIVNHTKVAYYAMTNSEMHNQGATVLSSALVVTDNRIVTGGGGGGPYAGGYETAPTVEVCAAMVKAVSQTSHVDAVEVTPSTWNVTATYQINVVTQDPCDSISVLNDTDILTVRAYVYPEGEFDTSSVTLTLLDNDEDGIYSGTFSDLAQGSYHIDVEVSCSDDTVEVVSVGTSITYIETGVSLLILEIALILGAAVVVVGLGIFLKKRV